MPPLSTNPETGQIFLDEIYRNGPTGSYVMCANCVGGGIDELSMDGAGFMWQMATDCPECGAALEVLRQDRMENCHSVSSRGELSESAMRSEFAENLSEEVRCETQACDITDHIVRNGRVWKPVLKA